MLFITVITNYHFCNDDSYTWRVACRIHVCVKFPRINNDMVFYNRNERKNWTWILGLLKIFTVSTLYVRSLIKVSIHCLISFFYRNTRHNSEWYFNEKVVTKIICQFNILSKPVQWLGKNEQCIFFRLSQ